MSDTFFTILYFVFVFAASIIRGVYSKQFRQNREYTDKLDKFLTILPVFGMFIFPVIYALTSWLDFADYQLPTLAGWFGATIFTLSLWVLWRSHADLGRQWSVKVEIQEEHKLVTDGIFKHIRHPMYAAHILWGIAQPLLLWNWIAGLSMLVTIFPLYFYRVPKEEGMMVDEFGDEYRHYKDHTGRLFPKLGND
jgi:protein-S-isoprenylcysteine O-methyltransferase Ste14